jgi:nucleoside-diphosphate-sugar epimerase
MDFSREECCRFLLQLFRETKPVAVIHLAFVIDPVRTGILDLNRMWQTNVAGTARVMEAITEANREVPLVEKFIYPSSVSAYGPSLPQAVDEDYPLAGHTLPYAIHKRESDEVVQRRAPSLRHCSAYILRPHIFAGASVQNYMMGAFQGIPGGKSDRAGRMRAEGRRLPCILPHGERYLQNQIQFVHVDDVARLIQFMVEKHEPEARRLTILNVAGRGEPLTFRRCLELAEADLIRVPGAAAFRLVLKTLWKLGISAIPPEAAPYMTSEYIMNTGRLQNYLGSEYENVIRYSVEEAFVDSFQSHAPVRVHASVVGEPRA